MHVMFIHPNFPAQFGHIAWYLKTQLGWDATCVTSIDTRHLNLPFTHINYKVYEGPQPTVFYNPNDVQTLLDHLLAVYKGLRGVPEIRPDLVVGHMSYGTMLYLRNLYDCPFVGYFELLPPPFWTDALALRKEFPPPEATRLFNATFHALTYLHLHAVDAVYTPTHYQMSTAPKELHYKFRVIFDGVDADFFQRRPLPRPYEFHGRTIDADTRVVTYVSYGLESARGFDIFMQVAKRIYQTMANVVFLVAGAERTYYGHDLHHIGPSSFKQWVLSRGDYDLSKFHFLDVIPIADLATLFSLSDVHIYLTTPYILSWSLIQAMSNQCAIVGSATAPLQEAIDNGAHGLLADFYDVDGLADLAIKVLNDPGQHRHLGVAARARVLERYEARKCIGQLVEYFQEVQMRRTDSAFANLVRKT
jgi:glycosyltransferase involved in cell wall biosynthesis